MAVRYIRVKPQVSRFTPAQRPTGNIAIVGTASAGPNNTGVPILDPDEADSTFGVASNLAKAIKLAYLQQPGPPLVYGVRTDADLAPALTAVEALSVQFVVLANTPLVTANQAAITALRDHVDSTSKTGDGKERMGIAMLGTGDTSDTVINATLAFERMVYVAHKSDQDVAAAVAGTIAGYDPHISMLLKRVFVVSAPFTAAEILAINGQEEDDDPPAGKGIIWLADPDLIPGPGVFLGEGYTGDAGAAGAKRFIDGVRTIDDITFRLKARLIASIGNLRISRSGLRSLIVQMEAVLDPLVQDAVIDAYGITIPILDLMDRDPATLTDGQTDAIQQAQTDRLVEVFVNVDYAGAIHRILINLKFD